MARATASGLIIAIKGFQTEYRQLPVSKDYAVSETIPLTSSGSLLYSLMGDDDAINPRKIKFLDPPPARKEVNGLLEKEGKRMVVDPWGQLYSILLDLNEDGKIPDPEHPGTMLDTTVIVFSSGPDGNLMTWQDNVTSWK